MEIKIVKGNAFDYPARALVVPLNDYLHLSVSNRHISGLVNQKAGPDLQAELYRRNERNKIEPGEYVITGSYNIREFQTLAFMNSRDLTNKTIKDGISEVVDLLGQYDSITTPLFATGTGGVSTEAWARSLKEYETAIKNQPAEVLNVVVPENKFGIFMNIFNEGK